MHWSGGEALAHEALLLLWVWDHPWRAALHHEGRTATLLQLLWVPVCRVLWCMWRTHRYLFPISLTCCGFLCINRCKLTCFSILSSYKSSNSHLALLALCATAVERWSQDNVARKWMIIIILSPRISESVCFSRHFHIVYYMSDTVMDIYLSMGAGFAIFCVILHIQWAFSHKCFPSGEKHWVNRLHVISIKTQRTLWQVWALCSGYWSKWDWVVLICSTISEEHLYRGVTNFKKLMRKVVVCCCVWSVT